MANDAFAPKRKRMTELHIASRGITRRPLLDAFLTVPRECFVPDHLQDQAYDDRPLPIGGGQTISQPYIVARTVDALELDGADRVLEIGAGSGYAAAILGHVAREVHTVERVDWLAKKAAERLARLGFANVHVHHGDGTGGLPSHAPYDAIAVAAGGPVVPQPFLDQLAIGGRLVMPVTTQTGFGQALVRVRRISENEYEQEELEPVHFVPLIGARGHASADDAEAVARPYSFAQPGTAHAAARLVREVAESFTDFDDVVIDTLVDRLASARIVLLGESTHGTAEFYRLRACITQRLVERHGFSFVAVEADWPDAARVDAYAQSTKPTEPRFTWKPFSRFPTWMWRNEEFLAFATWLRRYNQTNPRGDRRARAVGFHGLDLYSMYTSMGIVVSYLDEVDPRAAHQARCRYARLLRWEDAPEEYGLAVDAGLHTPNTEAVVATLRDLLRKRLDYTEADGERFFDAAQNARVVTSAEHYYRAMVHGDAQSWNLRDSHMFDTLRVLLAHYGPRSKGIVWAHNSHVGDARACEMSERKELNVGQLCRQAFAEESRIVGLATHHGDVLAAREWGGEGRVITVRAGHPESYEHVFHGSGLPAFVLRLREPAREALHDELRPARLLRAIGVIYLPETELESHYVHTSLPDHFDELVWFDESRAVRPLVLGPPESATELPETYPFAV